jgi:hypothetical protein
MKPLVILLIAAALASCVGAAGSTLRDYFPVPTPQEGEMQAAPAAIDVAAVTAASRKRVMKNAVLVDAIIGAAIGLMLASAAGWIARGRTVLAAGVGLLGGAIAGAAGGFLGSYINDHDRFPESAAVARTPLVHATLWILIAAALALAVAFATRRRNALSLLGRLTLYAVIAAVVYPVLASIAFPLLNSDKAIPEGLANTGLWIALTAGLFAFAIAQANRQAGGSESSTPVATG